MKTIYNLLSILIPVISFAQSAPEIEWQKCYGGSEHDYFTSIKKTFDGGYILGCWGSSMDGDVSSNYGLTDIWIVKIDIDGNIEWEKNFAQQGFHI